MAVPDTTGLEFRLTYANVPFCNDVARTVRMPGYVPPHSQPGTHQTPEKHQVDVDLMEEVNRLLPLQYLQDFSPTQSYPGNRLGTIANPWSERQPNVAVRVGEWYYPNNASRWSVFRGLMTSAMVKQVVSNLQTTVQLPNTGGETPEVKQWNPGVLEMRSMPVFPNNFDATGDHRFDYYNPYSLMWLLPPRPIGEHAGLNRFGFPDDGLYLVTLVDERYYWQFRPARVRIRYGTTWEDVISQLRDSLGIDPEKLVYSPIEREYGTPEADSGLWANQSNAAALMDAVAYNLGRVFVRGFDGYYTLQTADESESIVQANRFHQHPAAIVLSGYPDSVIQNEEGMVYPVPSGYATVFSGDLPITVYNQGDFLSRLPVIRVAGGEIFHSGLNIPGPFLPVGDLRPARNAVLPGAFRVAFPKYVTRPVPHFHNTRYQNQRPSSWDEAGGPNVLIYNVPIFSGGPEVSGLTGVSGTRYTVHSTAKALLNHDEDAFLADWISESGNSTWTIPAGTAGASGYPYALNHSGLNALAMTMANSYYEYQVGISLDEVFPGTLSWTPEGQHDLIWTYSTRQGLARLRVLKTEWNEKVLEHQHASPNAGYQVTSGTFVISVEGEDEEEETIFFEYPVVPSGYVVNGTSVDATYASGEWVSGVTGFPRGVGGKSVAQTWRDTTSGTWDAQAGGIDEENGPYYTWLITNLASGSLKAWVSGVNYLPTQNPWRGRIGSEAILFAGTSGGMKYEGSTGDPESPVTSGRIWIDIIHRGIDGTRDGPRFSGDTIYQIVPNETYGVNLVSVEKSQFFFPGKWISGGIQEVTVVPQTQTVKVLDGDGEDINGVRHYSGIVQTYDPSFDPDPYSDQETVWVVERSSGTLTSGNRYGGQLVAFSKQTTTTEIIYDPDEGYIESVVPAKSSPIYLVDKGGGTGTTVDIVRVTSSVRNGEGYYPGKIQSYDVNTRTWSDGDDVHVLELN